MTKTVTLALILAFSAISSFGQSSNTAAGLAGVGAGAALGAASANQNATTPSSIGGGGGSSSPIEIQVMAFHGLSRIAKEIAGLTAARQGGCRPFSDKDGLQLKLDNRMTNLKEKLAESESDIISLDQHPAILAQDLLDLRNELSSLEADVSKTPGCAVLIEDPTSANQIALYQSVQGYHDNLQQLYDRLQDYFSLQTTPSSGLTFSATPQSLTIKVTNFGKKPIVLNGIKTNNAAFKLTLSDGVTPSDCNNTELGTGQYCVITVTFTYPGTVPANPPSLSGELTIPNGQTGTAQVVPLAAKIAAHVPTPEEEQRSRQLSDLKALQDKLNRKAKTLNLSPQEKKDLHDASGMINSLSAMIAQAPSAAGAPAPAGAPATGAGGAATSPIELTYLSGVMTALAGVKSGISYSPSSFQPTTQAFIALIQQELRIKGIDPYTSTSPLNLAQAKTELSYQFGEMLDWSGRVNSWVTLCKPPSTGTGTTTDSTKPAPTFNTACAAYDVIADLAVAQQLMTGYTTLVSTSNDGSGNPVVVDVLRGKVLSDKMKEGIPSLQVSVAGAGGSTRNNSFFLLNLFYTPKPSYNAGVIATFEFRDKDNVLLESGARDVLFDYTKWKPESFDPKVLNRNGGCGSFCVAQ